MVRQRLSKGFHKGPLSEEEVGDRIYKQIQIIEDEANRTINIMSIQSPESKEVLAKEIASEPKELIDEWVEKLRGFTERHTVIHYARLRRIAKLQVLDAFGDVRERIKGEARERIKEKMTGNSKECDELLGRMLYQGLVRLMEHTVLVHTTKPDIKKVEKHYGWVTKKYYDETNIRLKLVTSKHPLKSSYYGRIVLSDKKSTMFVDVNLHKNVDKIADEVFTQIAAAHGKYKNPLVLEIKALRALGFQIMPRGPGITNARLDILLSTMHGDPRSQVPTFCLVEESRKEIVAEVDSNAPVPSRMNRRKLTIPFISPPAPGATGAQPEPMMSVVPAKYMFRQQEEMQDESSRTSKDLYNLESGVSSIELTQDTASMHAIAGQSAVWRNMPSRAKAMAQSHPPAGEKNTYTRPAPRLSLRGDAVTTPANQRLPLDQRSPDSARRESKSSGTPPHPSVTFRTSEESTIAPSSPEPESSNVSRNSSEEKLEKK